MSKQFIAIATMASLMPALTMAGTHADIGKFFVGLGVGGQKADYNLSISEGNKVYRNSATDQNMVGAVTAGYRHSLSNGIFLGGDVEASYNKAKAHVNLGETNPGFNLQPLRAHLNNDYTLGAGIKAGILHEKTSFYVRLGVASSTLKINANNSRTDAAARTFSHKKALMGFALGGGIEHMLNEQVAVGLDLRSTVYKAKKFASANVDPAEPDTRFSVKVKPRFHQAMLTIKYFIK